MLVGLRYPIRPEAPTIAYQLTIDFSVGSPRVVETPTLGFPFELSVLSLSANTDPAVTIFTTILLSTIPWVSGESRDGYIIHAVRGSFQNADARHIPYVTDHTLTLRPRIRVPVAGYRIRMVNTVAAAANNLRGLFILTPLD